MAKFTQLQWVKKEIEAHGKISRNTCLKNYVSRLSAIISVLKEEGYQFDAKFVKYQSMFGWTGTDYVYTATVIPDKFYENDE